MKCRRLKALTFRISNKGRLSGITAKTALNHLYFIYCVSHRFFMKIIEVSKAVMFYVTTDSDELYEYKRYSEDNWTVTMGESDEPVYDCEELEEMFQTWLDSNGG